MSRITKGQKFDEKIVGILNKCFKAKTAQGHPFTVYRRASWPQGAPFLVNKHDTRREETVVWFPFVTDDPKSKGVGDWLNVVSAEGWIITTMYVGESPLQKVFDKVGRFIGKNHIVFARRMGQNNNFEFFGVYTSERKGDKIVFRRFADFLEPSAWNR